MSENKIDTCEAGDDLHALADEFYNAIENAAKIFSKILSKIIENYKSAFEKIAETITENLKTINDFAEAVDLKERRKIPRPNYKYSPKLPNPYIKQIKKSRPRERKFYND